MATMPFLVVMEVDLTANARGSLAYTTPTNETLHVKRILFQSTGNFSVQRLETANTYNFTNAGTATDIPNAFFTNVSNDFNNIGNLPEAIKVEGGDQIRMDVIDDSGAANTVTCILECVKEVG